MKKPLRSIVDSTHPEDVAERFDRGAPLSLLLDYDGTLVPFAPTPDEAAPDEELRRLLAAVASRPNTHVEIVSGRDPGTLGQWLGDLPIDLRAEHGAWVRATGEPAWSSAVAVDARAVALASDRTGVVTGRIGGWVERKLTGAAWHYRGVDLSDAVVDEVALQLEEQLGPIGFSILRGACIVEARARGIDKGAAVRDSLERSPNGAIAAIGDDTTDEDMFRALPETQVGILVGDAWRATAASHRFVGVQDVRAFLASLAAGEATMAS